MAGTEKPIGIALLICDRVISDALTHEKTLISTFNEVFAPSLPCMHPRITIFVAVTNGQGMVDAKIKCISELDQSTVFGMKGSINFPDPNHVVEMSFQFNNVTFTKPGLHCVEFLCDGELILQSRFHVTTLSMGKTL